MKNKAATYSITNSQAKYSKLGDYLMLLKVRLSLVVVLTSAISYGIAAGAAFKWIDLFLLAIGGFCITGAANTLNQVLEKDFDRLMERTANRPLAVGRMKISEAVLFAGLMGVFGILILATFNPLTVLLSVLALISYAFVYTPMKRYSTLAVAVGAIPGALPVLIGFSAFDGYISSLAFGLFSIQFLWQFPHFWSIGFLSFTDYKNAGYKLLPQNALGEMDRKVGLYSLLYCLLIMPVAVFIFKINGAVIPLIVSVILTVLFGYTCYRLHKFFDRKSALMVMFASFIYMPVLLIMYCII